MSIENLNSTALKNPNFSPELSVTPASDTLSLAAKQISGASTNHVEAGLSASSDLQELSVTNPINARASDLFAGEAANELLIQEQSIEKTEGQTVPLSSEIAAKTLDDARLSMDSYNDTGAPEGYTRLSQDELNLKTGETVVLNDNQTGFDAAVYKHNDTGKITIAFRGSEANNLDDIRQDWLGTNVGQGFGSGTPESYKQGSTLAEQINAAYANEAAVSLTGHSMGGGIANFAAIDNNMNFTGFNAAGLSQNTVDGLGAKVDNYTGSGTIINDKYDPLTNLGGNNNAETFGTNAKHIGYDELVFVDNNNFNNWFDNFNINKRVDAHNLGSVIPMLERAVA